MIPGPAAARLALIAALLDAPFAAAQVVLHETRSQYVLDAADVPALRAQLAGRLAERAEDGGVISHGLTRAELQTRYELEPVAPAGCRLARIEVSLSIDTLLPVWHPARRPEADLAPRVSRMLDGLATHEAGHRGNALAAARTVDAALRGLAPSADCKALRRAAQRLVSRALLRLRVREWSYDQATGGGRGQGAVLEAGREVRRRSAARR